jgi:PAS domain S-box-containing protein
VESSLKTGTIADRRPAIEAVSGPESGRDVAFGSPTIVPQSPIASESRLFDRLLERTAQPFLVIDLEGRFLWVNRAFEALVGYSAEELASLTIQAITPEHWHAAGRESLAAVCATGRPARYEKEYRRKDGSLVPIDAQVDLARGDHGEPVGYTAFVTDISERKQMEDALRVSEERFRRLYDEAPVGYHEVDTEGRVVNINETECEMLGYAREEVIGQPVFIFVAPEFREKARAGFPAKARGDVPLRTIERTFQTRDGKRIFVAIEEGYRRDDQGHVIGIRSTVQDITDRKRTEAALTESEARYRQLTEGCLDAVVVADAQGTITLFNPAAETTFGYDASEILGRSFDLLIPGLFVAPDRSHPATATAGAGDQVHPLVSEIAGKTVELRGRRKGGEEFPLELSLSAITLAGVRQYLGSIRDQTERQRMRAVLAQSEKLASIGLLSAGVAHEINNPLAYVGNNLAVLERDLDGVLEIVALYEQARPLLAEANPALLQRINELGEELDWDYVKENLHRMLARTREGVQRVATIVSNLRGLARTSPTKMETVLLNDLLESAHEMVRGRMRRHNIELRVEHGPDVPRLTCVAAQIGQVILNLLVNAVQAIETTGRSEGGWVRFSTARVGDSVLIAVADNGCGIEESAFPQLFDPFFTTKSVGEGTGLGLSITHGIVTGHGGRIEVESRPNEGTCFKIYLPLKSSG